MLTWNLFLSACCKHLGIDAAAVNAAAANDLVDQYDQLDQKVQETKMSPEQLAKAFDGDVKGFCQLAVAKKAATKEATASSSSMYSELNT